MFSRVIKGKGLVEGGGRGGNKKEKINYRYDWWVKKKASEMIRLPEMQQFPSIKASPISQFYNLKIQSI